MTDYPNNIPAKLEIIKASEITPREVRWLWYPYIPFGKVTLLQGDPGDGKYKLYLSTKEELKAEIETQKAMFYFSSRITKKRKQNRICADGLHNLTD